MFFREKVVLKIGAFKINLKGVYFLINLRACKATKNEPQNIYF